MNISNAIKFISSAITLNILTSSVCLALPFNREVYDLAVSEAKQNKKVLGIYFDKPGSDACSALKWRLIGKDRFEALTKGDLVFLMIQDRGTKQNGGRLMNEADLQLENQFSITSYPTFILLSYDGKLIDRIDGFNWHEDPQGDKYYERILEAIRQGKATNASIASDSATAPPAGINSPLTPVHAYEGDVMFTFGDGTKLVSRRTIQVTSDKTLMRMDSIDYFEEDKFVKYVSKLLMKGHTEGNTFNSFDQQALKTDYNEWVPESITILFSPDGETATMTSIYQNSTGRVVGKGVLKLLR